MYGVIICLWYYLALACPKLVAPANGVLVPHSCASGKTFAGQQCTVRCKRGHRLIGNALYQCLPSQQWKYPQEEPRCERIGKQSPHLPSVQSINIELLDLWCLYWRGRKKRNFQTLVATTITRWCNVIHFIQSTV